MTIASRKGISLVMRQKRPEYFEVPFLLAIVMVLSVTLEWTF